MQQRKDIAHAFRHDPRDQLDPHLRSREHLRHRGRGLVLQRVGVDALRLFAEAGAGFQLGIETLQHRINKRRNIRYHLPSQSVRESQINLDQRHQAPVGFAGVVQRHRVPDIARA